MKFSTIAQGTRAERIVDLPGYKKEDGSPIRLALRPLTGAEEQRVLESALTDAKKGGSAEPKPGDQLYDLAIMAHTLALGCLDVDSPVTARAPFFDQGAAHLLENLHVETITYLFERHDQWQSECSPYVRQMSLDALLSKAREVASPEGEAAFTGMSPGMRWVFARSMAALLVTSPELSALFTSSSSTTDATTPPAAPAGA